MVNLKFLKRRKKTMENNACSSCQIPENLTKFLWKDNKTGLLYCDDCKKELSSQKKKRPPRYEDQ